MGFGCAIQLFITPVNTVDTPVVLVAAAVSDSLVPRVWVNGSDCAVVLLVKVFENFVQIVCAGLLVVCAK